MEEFKISLFISQNKTNHLNQTKKTKKSKMYKSKVRWSAKKEIQVFSMSFLLNSNGNKKLKREQA